MEITREKMRMETIERCDGTWMRRRGMGDQPGGKRE